MARNEPNCYVCGTEYNLLYWTNIILKTRGNILVVSCYLCPGAARNTEKRLKHDKFDTERT